MTVFNLSSRALVFVLLLASTARAQDETLLRWKFTTGDSQQYRLTQTAKLDLKLSAGQTVNASMHREFDFLWSVLDDSKADSATVSVQVSRVLLRVVGPGGQDTVFDSASEEEPRGYAATLGPLFRDLLKSELSALLSVRGKVTDLRIPEDLEIVLGTKPVGKALGTLGTREDLLPLVNLATPILPENMVSIENTWETEQTRDSLPFGATVGKTQFRLESIEDGLATIGTTTELQLISSEGGDPAGEIEKQDCNGKIVFDLSVGRPTRVEQQERLEIKTDHGKQEAVGSIEHRLLLEQIESKD